MRCKSKNDLLCAMLRRTFFTNITLTAVGAWWPFRRAAAISSTNMKKKRIKPAPIRPGATIALIAPASPPSDSKIEQALNNLEAMGFRVQPGTHLRTRYGYLAGTDTERVADIHEAFSNPDIDAVWCVRGGYGCTRLLPLLDMDLIRKHPKPLIGFSDVTALHIALYQEAGLVSFHGQVGGGDMTPFTLRYLQHTLFSPQPTLEIGPFEGDLVKTPTFEAFTLRSGRAQGPLIGGNLALLSAMAGTEWAPRFKDHIVYIEEIGEAPYRIDRMLTQLLQGSDLRQAAGIVLGIFADCIQKGDTPSFTLKETLLHCFEGQKVPVYYGAPFGHISDQCVLPCGIHAEMDADRMTLRLLEAGVA